MWTVNVLALLALTGSGLAIQAKVLLVNLNTYINLPAH